MFKMIRSVWTQDQMNLVISIWYKHDEIFQHIARGLVQTQVSKELVLYGDFIWVIQGYADKGWCRPKPVEA
jgi:hypothetical protein